MLLENQLSDIAEQYYFIKHTTDYISSVLFYDNFVFSSYIDRFKSTAIYKKFAYNLQEDRSTREKKEKVLKAYIDLIKSAGLAIESAILSGIDKLVLQNNSQEDFSEDICNYFDDYEYSKYVYSLLPDDDNIIDKATYLIVNSNFEDDILEKLKGIQEYFDNVTSYNKKHFKYFKKILPNALDFNYTDIKEILKELYEKAKTSTLNEDDQDDEDNQDKKEVSQQNMPANTTSTQNNGKRKNLSVEDALDKNFEGLIGLKDVKETILRKAKLILKAPKKAVDCNFRIVGNPGVGKTTVAEAMSRTFYDSGIIKNPIFISLNGAELKAKYVGQTAPLVKSYFQKAHGGTLFLDEVYSLNGNGANTDSFTQEAITQLMIEVENAYKAQIKDPNDKTLIIMAGYKDKLAELLEQNIGFKRRFSNIIDIKDYSVGELEAIFHLLMQNDGFYCSVQTASVLSDILQTQKQKPNFSNAGYVRNLLQKAEEYQAGRAKIEDFELTADDLKQSSKALEDEENNSKPMGFGA